MHDWAHYSTLRILSWNRNSFCFIVMSTPGHYYDWLKNLWSKAKFSFSLPTRHKIFRQSTIFFILTKKSLILQIWLLLSFLDTLCCIFLPAFGCCALQTLVEIVIFSVFAANNLKKARNLQQILAKNSYF